MAIGHNVHSSITFIKLMPGKILKDLSLDNTWLDWNVCNVNTLAIKKLGVILQSSSTNIPHGCSLICH